MWKTQKNDSLSVICFQKTISGKPDNILFFFVVQIKAVIAPANIFANFQRYHTIKSDPFGTFIQLGVINIAFPGNQVFISCTVIIGNVHFKNLEWDPAHVFHQIHFFFRGSVQENMGVPYVKDHAGMFSIFQLIFEFLHIADSGVSGFILTQTGVFNAVTDAGSGVFKKFGLHLKKS